MHPHSMQMRQYLYFCPSKCVSICTFVLVTLACIRGTAQPPLTSKRLALSLIVHEYLPYSYSSTTTDSSGPAGRLSAVDICELLREGGCGPSAHREVIKKKGARLEAGDQVRTHTHTHKS